jgi:hypothetical protein
MTLPHQVRFEAPIFWFLVATKHSIGFMLASGKLQVSQMSKG